MPPKKRSPPRQGERGDDVPAAAAAHPVEENEGDRKRARSDAAAADAVPSPPAADAASHWGLLPSDIWRQILALLPLRARVLVVSLVSQRFLQLVRRSISSLPRMTSRCQRLALSLLPSVTSIEYLAPGVEPPAKVQHLSIDSDLVQPLRGVTSLTSLHIDTNNAVTAENLLRNNAHSLTSLSFRYTPSSVVLQLCQHVHLPALRSLALCLHLDPMQRYFPVYDNDLRNALTAWISNHISQLTSLTLLGEVSVAAFPLSTVTHLPQLRKLVLSSGTASVFGLSVARACLQAFGAPLDSIALGLKPEDAACSPDAIPQLAPYLVELFAGGSPLSQPYKTTKSLMESILQCTRLRHLHVTSTQCLEVLWDFAPIRRLTLNDFPRGGSKLFRFPNLDTLEMPLLFSWKDSFSHLTKIVMAHPKLRTIKLLMQGTLTRSDDLGSLETFLQYAEEAGVESMEFDFRPAPDRDSPVRRVIRQCKWLDVVVV